jgi:hypothetical protein
MGRTVFTLAVDVTFFLIGASLIRNPKPFLAKLGRPATDRHTRATRFIGAMFLIFVLLTVIQWLRGPR